MDSASREQKHSKDEPLRDKSAIKRVDLNADLGESFGRYRLGDDEALLQIVTSANVACGFHAGDPNTMLETVLLAQKEGVTLGAHPGYPDREGFGRRILVEDDPQTITNWLLYQIGALQAVARSVGSKVRFVRTHGALANLSEEDQAVAAAVVKATVLAQEQEPLALMSRPGSATDQPNVPDRPEEPAFRLRRVRQVFADRAYQENGSLAPRGTPGAVLSDPQLVADRALEMIQTQSIRTLGGNSLPVDIDTITLHGDTPGAIATATAVRAALEGEGIRVASFLETER